MNLRARLGNNIECGEEHREAIRRKALEKNVKTHSRQRLQVHRHQLQKIP